MLKRVACLRIASRLAFAMLASALGSAVCVVEAGDVGIVLAPAASPGPALGSIANGGYHGCAVRAGGTVACWGRNLYGESTPPAGTFTEIAASVLHTCGLKTDGTLACWGSNNYGQRSPPAGTFTQVAAGGHHTCAAKTEGAFVCWGDNTFGQVDMIFKDGF